MKPCLTMKFLAFALAAGLSTAPVAAQTVVPPSTVPAPATADTPTSKLTTSFSNWAGSPENANALVTGLRSGKSITLTSGTAPAGSPAGSAESTTFTPPTKPMGYGNVRIALSLAQQQLASQGITQPTPQQLQTALVGSSTAVGGTQTASQQGILQMRASGMGWGKIANTMGVKLGSVMSGKAAAVPPGTDSGITTATGSSAGQGTGKSAHAKTGSGIVTAAGSTGGGITTGMGNAYGHGANSSGVVTAHGNAGGGGSGNAGSHGKSGK